jgi:hypothetical protein
VFDNTIQLEFFGIQFAKLTARNTLSPDDARKLLFSPPPRTFMRGIVFALLQTCHRLSEIPEVEKLFDFLFGVILFNGVKCYEPTLELFDLATLLLTECLR